MINYAEIEAKWQKAWNDARIFESEANDKPSFMVTAAFPYANSPLHIGHLRTYGTADMLARYKRMKGFNVLYPMAFHGTGTPVLAFAKRIRNNDQELIQGLKIFHVSDEEIKKMTDPQYIVDYFTKELENGMHLSGLSIDWRRRFTSLDPIFSKFVEWQFGILSEKGYLTKGKHPIGWCPNENNAVGGHDTKYDIDPEIEEQTAVRFMVDGEQASMLCATYRPETIFGVTNVFVKEGVKYALCKIEGEDYYLAKAAAEILGNQFAVEIIKEVDGAEMLKKTVINPLTGQKVPVFPGFFVKEEIGTGIVMSVPAHAPFDYAALQKLKSSGYPMPEIKPIKVIEVEVGRSMDNKKGEAKPMHLDIPALAYLDVLNINSDAVDDMLESTTKLEYKEESHWGKMIVKGYEGMSEPEARDKIKKELIENKKAINIYVLQNAPVICRCGYNVVVKVVDNQWFINYGNEEWKNEVKGWFGNMKILPEKTRSNFTAVIDWIDLRAVARAQGLGTKFPLNRNFIIESLSDSTIYMAFYTISNLIKNIEPEKLKPEFFDYVFLGKGEAEMVFSSTEIDYETIKKCRDSFTYWYVYTSRHSGPDLIPNHLTMYMFNHVAIFARQYWPKQIVTNGFVLSEGEKMSKSLGNITPLVDGVAKAGADPLRIVELAGADLFSDSNYSEEAVNGVKERLDYLCDSIFSLDKMETGELKHIDYWLYSKLNRKIANVTRYMDGMELRDAATNILYNSIIELRRYSNRGGNNGMVTKEFLSNISLMLQPMSPHVAEEFWHMLGNTTFASMERWPSVDESMINQRIEEEEELLESTVADAKQISALMAKKGNKPKEIRIIIASDWKRKINNMIAEQKDIGKVLESIKSDDSIDKEAAAKYVGEMAKKMKEMRKSEVTQENEFVLFNESEEYMERMLDCKIGVEKEEDSNSERAKRAAPLKPSIDIRY